MFTLYVLINEIIVKITYIGIYLPKEMSFRVSSALFNDAVDCLHNVLSVICEQINERTVQVELYWQWNTEVLVQKSVPVRLCPPQIQHGLTRYWTQPSMVRG